LKRKFLYKRLLSTIFVPALTWCVVFGASFPLLAADRVVVIPMGKGGAPAPVAKTGQTTAYNLGDDGYFGKGVGITSGRFVDNNNGTVTDKLTGLIWLKDGMCHRFFSADSTDLNERPWASAIVAANYLADPYCGLSDGSKAGDWRLPNMNELNSLIDRGQYDPAMPANCPLSDSTVASYYWSSTTSKDDHYDAWEI